MRIKITKRNNDIPFAWYNRHIGKEFEILKELFAPIKGFSCRYGKSVGIVPFEYAILVKQHKKRGPKPKCSDKLFALEVKRGLTQAQISRKYKFSRQFVSQRCKDLNLKAFDGRVGKRSERVVKNYSLKPETIDQVNKLTSLTGKLKGEVVELAVKNLFAELS